MLNLSVARAPFVSCTVACVGGALLLTIMAASPIYAAPVHGHPLPITRHAFASARRPAATIPMHRGALTRRDIAHPVGAIGLRGRNFAHPVIQHDPALSPELAHDYGDDRDRVPLSADGWMRSVGASWPAVEVGEFALAMLSNASPAESAASLMGGCAGSGDAVTCSMQWGPPVNPFIRIVPRPADAAEQTLATERDRRWVAYCRPFIVQDRYGVPRYHYARAGCEFGALGN